MRNNNALSISLYSALANGIKMIAGPITLLFISKNLNSEQISFYYTFFSFVAMQQLAELGLGHTLKQYISHAYKLENHNWVEESKSKIKVYILFGFKWFFCVAIFMILVVGPIGWYYYSDYTGNVVWLFPWISLVIVSALVTALIPVQILIEATQNQKIVYQAQSVSALINSVSIWALLTLDFSLYTISLALIISNIFFYSFLWSYAKSLYDKLSIISVTSKAVTVFKELWPLLSRVSIVWGVGFLFWNGFNLISFKIYSADYAGKVIFTIALARAGFGLADSLFSSQITAISYQIAQGQVQQAKEYAKKYQKFSITVLLIGYFTFCVLANILSDFFLFQKIVDMEYTISIFLFFTATLLLTTQNNFIRCFKVEPFVYVSVIQGGAIPLAFYLSNSGSHSFYFYPCVLIMVGSIVASRIISTRFLVNRS